MTSNGSIHPDTALGAVSLTVTNLDRSLDFYQRVLGFRLHRREDGTAALGAGGTDLVLLHEDPAARRYRGTSGLYHFAILLPNRRELGRAILQLLKERYLNYPTDHIMTKSDYLDDPDGNGIELYCESPEDGEFVVANGSLITRRADGYYIIHVESGKEGDYPLVNGTPIGPQARKLHDNDVMQLAGVKMGFFES